MTEQPKRNRTGDPWDRGQGKKKEKIIMVVMIILAVIMVLAATVAVLYTRWVKKPTLPSDPTTSDSVSPDPTREPSGTEPPGEELEEPDYDPVQPKVSGERKSKNFYTILVFGSDVASGLTDTMMLVSYDVTNQQATVMSIPRDTLTNARFKGIDTKKMNAVYKMNGSGDKGITALKNEVSELVGFTPDYYVMIDWELVGQMVDAIGGVYFDVPYHMGYDDPYQDLHIHFEPGYQYLDGKAAMNLVRWRKNNDGTKTEGGGGDVSRLDVQHQFLKAVLKQVLQLKNVTRISQLAELFGENVTSDLSIENLFWFGSQAILGGLNVDDVEFVTMPYGIGSYPVNGDNRSFVYPLQKKLLTLINESLNPFVKDVTIRELDLMSVASDGSLRSSTGVLADSSVGKAPVTETPEPSESQPTEPDDPNATENPNTTEDPGVSQDPGASESLPPTEPIPSTSPDPGTEPSTDPDSEMPEWLQP